MKDKLKNGSPHQNENEHGVVEMARIKEQIVRGISNTIRERHSQGGLARNFSRIPAKLLPQRFCGNLVVDVVLAEGVHLTHLIVNSEGYVVSREVQNGHITIPFFGAESVFAVRVRSGFWGRMALTRFRSILD